MSGDIIIVLDRRRQTVADVINIPDFSVSILAVSSGFAYVNLNDCMTFLLK